MQFLIIFSLFLFGLLLFFPDFSVHYLFSSFDMNDLLISFLIVSIISVIVFFLFLRVYLPIKSFYLSRKFNPRIGNEN